MEEIPMQSGATCKWPGHGNEVRKWSQEGPSHDQSVWEECCHRTSALCRLSQGVILAERMGERGFFLSIEVHAWSFTLTLFAAPLAMGRKSIPSILSKDRKMQHTAITFEACTFSCSVLLLVQLWLKELAWSISTSFSSLLCSQGAFCSWQP